MHGIVHQRDSKENADILKKAKLDRSLKDERGSNPESARHLLKASCTKKTEKERVKGVE